jgi:hypothetical protein
MSKKMLACHNNNNKKQQNRLKKQSDKRICTNSFFFHFSALPLELSYTKQVGPEWFRIEWSIKMALFVTFFLILCASKLDIEMKEKLHWLVMPFWFFMLWKLSERITNQNAFNALECKKEILCLFAKTAALQLFVQVFSKISK